MSTPPSPRFLGLTAKLAILSMLLVTVCCAVLYPVARHQINQLQQQRLDQQWQRLQQQWQQWVDVGVAQAIAVASQHAWPKEVNSDQMKSLLAERFQQWRGQLGLAGMALFVDQEPLMQLGRTALPPLPVARLGASEIRCGDECVLQLALPIPDLVEAQLLLLLPLEPMLQQLAQRHQLQLFWVDQNALEQGASSDFVFTPAVLSNQPTQSLELTPTQLNKLGVLQGKASSSAKALLLGSSSQPSVLYLGLFGNNVPMVALAEQPSGLLLNHALGRNFLLAWLLMLVAAAIVAIVAARRPAKRLGKLIEQVPLLAQRRFEPLRRRLASAKPLLIDEVDRLEQVTKDVIKRLQQQDGENDRYTEELKRMAMFDGLTGLPNREMFLHELSSALSSIGRTDKQIALLFIDLDEFKPINDSLGHDVGDELLKTIARRLQKSVRGMDVVCRLGGDEFIVIVRGLVTEGDVHRIIHQLLASLQQPLQLGHQTLVVTASIGVAFCDNPNTSPDELVKRADLAMYKAKQSGRCNYRVFSEQMLASVSRREELERQIETAIGSDQIVMAVQPVIALDSNKIVGFEALCRWYRPQHGLVLPAQFINELEGCTQSLALAEDVIRQTTQLMARLSEQLNDQQFFVSMNLSPCQFLHRPLFTLIVDSLELNQLAPQRLVVEVTEEALIRDLDQAMAMMRRYQRVGIRIAIDDFGSGYSSLNYLKKLPFDILKIDKDLVAELDNSNVDRNIITSVIELTHSLGKVVIAEGVENHDQRHFLQRCGCDYAQGYLYAEPMAPRQLQTTIDKLHNHS